MIFYLWRNSVRTVIDLSALTFILLIKKKKKTLTLISLLSGHDKYISCPESHYAKFIFHSSMRQKIYLWFILFNSLEFFIVWFYAFHTSRYFTCTFGTSILTQKAHNTSKHNSDLKFNHNTCHKIIVAPNELCKVFLYMHHLIQSFCTWPIKINWNN